MQDRDESTGPFFMPSWWGYPPKAGGHARPYMKSTGTYGFAGLSACEGGGGVSLGPAPAGTGSDSGFSRARFEDFFRGQLPRDYCEASPLERPTLGPCQLNN